MERLFIQGNESLLIRDRCWRAVATFEAERGQCKPHRCASKVTKKLSSISKDIDSPKNSTPLTPVLLVDFCVRDMPATLRTRSQSVSSSPASCNLYVQVGTRLCNNKHYRCHKNSDETGGRSLLTPWGAAPLHRTSQDSRCRMSRERYPLSQKDFLGSADSS
jgi:hypothetical protein